jgi:hypothetical protein
VVLRSLLPTVAWWWWQTTAHGEAPLVTDSEEEGVRQLHHTLELLWEEEGDEELTGDGEFGGEGLGRHYPQRMGKSVIPTSLMVRR